MKTVIFKICSLAEAMQHAIDAVKSGVPAQSASYEFISEDLARQILTHERWQIVRLLCGRYALPVHAIAQHLKRDSESVDVDVAALLLAGIVERTDDGIRFPYREIAFDTSFPIQLQQEVLG